MENSINIFNKLRTMAQDVSEVQKLTQVGLHTHTHNTYTHQARSQPQVEGDSFREVPENFDN